MLLKLFKNLKFPVFKQQENSDCGVESLRMVLAYHKLKHEKHLVSEQFTVDEFGTNFYAIQRAAEKLGLDCIAAKISLQDLSNIPLPVIIHWRNDHFVVLYELTNDKAWIGDPAKGLDLIPASELVSACFNVDNLQIPKANVLIFEKSEKVAVLETSPNTLKPGLLYKNVLSSIIGATSISFILFVLFLLTSKSDFKFETNILLLTLTACCLLIGSIIFLKVLPVPEYYNSRSISNFDFVKSPYNAELIEQKVTEFLKENSVINFLKHNLSKYWLSIAVFFGIISFQLVISYKFSIAAILISLLYCVCKWVDMRFSENEHSLSVAGVSAIQNELSSGILKFVEAFKVGKIVPNDIDIQPDDSMIKIGSVRSGGLMQSIALFTGMIVLFFLFHQNNIDVYKVIWLSVTYLILIIITDQLLKYSWVKHMWNQGNNLKSRIKSKEQINQPSLPGSIVPKLEIRKMSFHYPSGNFDGHLANIDCIIEPGNKVAVIGRQGSGKTTLFSLLEGRQYPDKGEILLGGYSFSDLHPLVLKQHIGICSDSSEILPGSLLYNITLENITSAPSKLQEVMEATLINTFILTLKEGIHTYFDPHKEFISDSLKRKIILARLLYQDKNIMLIDFQDRYSDLIETLTLYDSIMQYCRDKTVLFSTNTQEMIQLVDKVLEIENGEQIRYCKAMDYNTENNIFPI